MATIRVCDWTKKVLAKDEDLFIVEIEGNEVHKFEVGAEGKQLLLEQLEGEDAPGTAKAEVQIVEKIVYRDTPPLALQSDLPGIDIEVVGDGFTPGPTSIPEVPQAQTTSLDVGEAAFDLGDSGDDELTPFEIPDSAKKKFKQPTKTQGDKVITDSTRFREGSLAALNPGAAAQRAANAKLRAIKNRDTKNLNSRANHGIRLKDLNDES